MGRVLVQCSAHPSGRLRRIVTTLEDAGFEVRIAAPSAKGDLPPSRADFDAVLLDPLDGTAASPSPVRLGDVDLGRLRIWTDRRLVEVDGQPLDLSAREYALLHHLASYPGIVFTREALLMAVWGSTWRTQGSVTEYIRRLRVHLRASGLAECVVTRPGFGYTLDPELMGERPAARSSRGSRRRRG